jgi:hypothetical protein
MCDVLGESLIRFVVSFENNKPPACLIIRLEAADLSLLGVLAASGEIERLDSFN